MVRLERRLSRLEQQAGRVNAPSWEEMIAAQERIGSYFLAQIEAIALGLPVPSKGLIASDRAICRAWDAANGGPFESRPLTREQIAKRATEVIAEIRSGERPIRDLPRWQGMSSP